MEDIGKLRPILEKDISTMLAWRNAPAVREHMYTRHEITEEEHNAWWSRYCTRTDQMYFMYEDKQQSLGIVGITAVDLINSNCSWAFYSSPKALRGTGSRMEYLTLEHVFFNLELNKLYCEVLSTNPAVVKLHKKFGFVVEGVFREQHKITEKYIDIYRLGLLKKEWLNNRTNMLEKLIAINKG